MIHAIRRGVLPPGFLGTAIASLVAASVTPSSYGFAHAAPTAASPVTLTIRVDAHGRGTFALRGGLVDGGGALVRRAVVSGRLNATETLSGAKGRIVLTSQQPCGQGSGTWRVVSGTLAYAQLSGRGTTTGRATCIRPLRPAVVVHRGTVGLPPPLLAEPGSWGGKTVQSGVVTFTVTPDGRAVTGVLVTRYRYECVRSDGLRTTESSPTQSRFTGPFAIADDRTFTVPIFDGKLSGRFGPSGAAGTITVARTWPPNIQGQTTTCSGSIAWTATNPPAPPPQARPGTYCGITAAGGGVCVDVPAGGREVQALRAEIKLSCGLRARIPVSVSVTYDRAIPFGLDLSFRQWFDHPFEGKTLNVTVSGTFDENGGLVGTVGVGQFTIERDGATQACRTNGGFTARLQR